MVDDALLFAGYCYPRGASPLPWCIARQGVDARRWSQAFEVPKASLSQSHRQQIAAAEAFRRRLDSYLAFAERAARYRAENPGADVHAMLFPYRADAMNEAFSS